MTGPAEAGVPLLGVRGLTAHHRQLRAGGGPSRPGGPDSVTQGGPPS